MKPLDCGPFTRLLAGQGFHAQEQARFDPQASASWRAALDYCKGNPDINPDRTRRATRKRGSRVRSVLIA
jgi:hypothetical protein